MDDPELRELAEALPSLALQGKATSTIKKYSGDISLRFEWFFLVLYINWPLHSGTATQ